MSGHSIGEECTDRIKRFQTLLRAQEVEGALIIRKMSTATSWPGPVLLCPVPLLDPPAVAGLAPTACHTEQATPISISTNPSWWIIHRTWREIFQPRIFSKGDLPEKFHRAHRIMLEVQEARAREGKPGAVAKDLCDVAMKIAEDGGWAQTFMGYPEPVPFVGHGLGLELDEWPIIGKDSDHILEKGMVLALEPKVIFPGEGVVGIENTFLVTEQGLEKLNRFPDQIVSLPL